MSFFRRKPEAPSPAELAVQRVGAALSAQIKDAAVRVDALYERLRARVEEVEQAVPPEVKR